MDSSPALDLSTFVQSVFEESMRSESELAEAVAAMQALIAVVGRSHASTIMGLQVELKEAAELLQAKHSSSISLRAGCELFNRYVTRTLEQDIRDFQQGKTHLLSRGKYFANMCSSSRNKISVFGDQFIHDNSTVLVHGRSRVVIGLLKYAALKGKQFSVVMTEGRPNNDTSIAAEQLLAVGVPVTIILDSAVAFKMAEVDCVLCGAEGVVENGGIINVIGTYQIAIIAQALNKPVYIAAECYKFTRLFPLTQKDIPNMIQLQHSEIDDLVDLSEPELNRFSSQRSFRSSTPFNQVFTTRKPS
jgi:translation initiation factor eIF-2B subunit alpha